MPGMELIENHLLIFNGLEHVEFELTRSATSYFRVARETHQILYRSLVDALRGTANIAVTGKPRGLRRHRYQQGNNPIKEIQKQSINGCSKAWRFSEPVIVDSFFETRDLEESQETIPDSEDFLIPFYDALAMAQADCFMLRYVHSAKLTISDSEMKLLEWLHESVRNEYEHFIPKAYLAPVTDLLDASILALTKAAHCLMESNNVLFMEEVVDQPQMESKFADVHSLLEDHRKKAAGDTNHAGAS
jgi:hypothetical protein